jgi:hypothetical protein
LVAFGCVVALLGCSRDPECRDGIGKQEVTRIRDLAKRGAAPCPELERPSLKLGAKGLELNGHVLATKADLPASGPPRSIDALWLQLQRSRALWRRVHPGETFNPLVEFEVAEETDFLAAASVFVTARAAGYPRARVACGAVTFEASSTVSLQPNAKRDDPMQLRIERLADGRYSARLVERSYIVVEATEPLDADGVVSWTDTYCKSSTCPDSVVLQMAGSFLPAAKLIRRLLDTKSLAGRPPAILFTTVW